jgi:hypothetical protein
MRIVQPHPILATPAREAAIVAVAELLTKLRTEFAFVGSVSRGAWLGEVVDVGAIDTLASLSAEGRHQVPMMASHRGFRIDEQTLQRAQELDLVPLRWVAAEEEVPVHVLIASNALYGNMVRDAVPARLGEIELRVVAAEDLALLLMMSEDAACERVRDLEGFRTERFNQRLSAIGLGSRMSRA